MIANANGFLAGCILLCVASTSAATTSSEFADALKNSGRNVEVTLPKYPEGALKSGTVGKVEFEFGLDAKGAAKELEIVVSEPPGIFDQVTLDALKSWRYLPNLDDPCTVEKARYRQVLWFEISDGEPRMSMSKVRDLPKLISPTGQLDKNANLARVAKDDGDERFILLKNIGLQHKASTLSIKYPEKARMQSRQGIVVVKMKVAADGTVSDGTIVYSIPSGLFDKAVLAAIPDLEVETVEGKAPGASIKACTTFQFLLH